ncbi:MAG TPA: BamA/TamA family outer membrane protein [Candidatus Bathyarchaeia archaeon]|nr:BamA/TamA family outer membrane protein [Candidatus Bathyarchaeia archaeon]
MNASTTADHLDVRAAWRLQSLKIEGGGFIRDRLIASQLETRQRSIFAFWRPYPEVDPAALMRDLDRIRRSLEADGYYAAQVTNEVVVLQEPVPAPDAGAAGGEGKGTPGLIAVTIRIEKGTPVEVCSLDIALGDTPIPKADEAAVRKRIPIAVGHVFTESDYATAANLLLTYFKEHGYAGAEVKREARVDVPGHCAAVAYTAVPGSPATFGETTISGLERIDPEIVRRELTYSPGQAYDSRDVAESQRRLQNLHLFSIARLNEQPMTQDGEVPMAANLREGPQHEVRAGIGYSSEEQVRGLLAWRDYNFLGGARQLGFSAKASVIERRINADFVQPHWPSDRGRTSLTYSLEQDDESTYLLTSSRVVPRVDYRLSRELSAFGFLRAEYDSLSGVSEQTKAVLAEYVSSGFTVSAGLGGEWRHVDNPIDPRQGVEFRTSAENAGSILDADFTYVRLIEDLSLYQSLPQDWVLATHYRLGFATPYGGTKEIPLWDRFYSGGTNSVRGYGRRRVGPISGSDDPVGGRSLFEGSAEMRHPLYGPIGGALFVDVGDVELQSWHIDPSDAQVGVGFGLRAETPIGPVRLDLGFGLDRPDHDSLVQVHFSIGPNF